MSDKSVAQKLLLRENYKVLIINEPKDYRTTLGELPQNVNLVDKPASPVDLIQVFITSGRQLQARLPGLKPLLKPGGLLWVSYPKSTFKKKPGINRDIIREYARTMGLEGVAMVSIDETWSAMRLKTV